jgi:hypothetical protein
VPNLSGNRGGAVEVSEEETALIELLRTPGLSIKNLDDEKRELIRRFINRLHHERGVSLGDIAKMIGNRTSGYTSWLCKQLEISARPFEEARLKGIKEKRRKYERTPFDGTDEDKAYLLGLRHGDLSASKPWRGVTRVSTSTTHPAMAGLFRGLFQSYGHVYQHPRYKEDTCSYEWNLSVILDNTFGFLLADFRSCQNWILDAESTTVAYLAGLLDAEGNVGIYRAKRATALTVTYYNTDLELMHFVHGAISVLGYGPLEPYLDKPKGFRSPGYHIEIKKDYFRVVLASFDESQSFLRRLPLRHAEKVAKKDQAVELTHREPWVNIEKRVLALRHSIRLERDRFCERAKDEYAKNHPSVPEKNS